MNRISLTLHQLKVFMLVAQHGGFTSAAEQLSTSQPGLTSAVQQLEEELQVRLFNRTTRRVELTAAGLELLPVAERIFAELDLTVQSLRDLGNVRRGLVVVAALPSLSATLLPQALAVFRTQYPNVKVQLREGIASEIVDMVRAGHVDFAVGNGCKICCCIDLNILDCQVWALGFAFDGFHDFHAEVNRIANWLLRVVLEGEWRCVLVADRKHAALSNFFKGACGLR